MSKILNNVSKLFPKLKDGNKYKTEEKKLGLSLNTLLTSHMKFKKLIKGEGSK